MAVRLMQIVVFELRRRRKKDVGVIGGVGLKMFEDDGEEILATQPFEDTHALRRDGCRIGVVDDERAHRRIARLGERFAEPRHVDRARSWTDPFVMIDVCRAHPKRRRRRKLHAAADKVPITGDDRQQRDRAHSVAAAGVSLQSVVEANE